jgi:hypothetical protein
MAVQAPTEIGAAQVGKAVRRCRMKPYRLKTDLAKIGEKPLDIEAGVHGIPRTRMRKLKVEVMRGRYGRTGALQANSGRCRSA